MNLGPSPSIFATTGQNYNSTSSYALVNVHSLQIEKNMFLLGSPFTVNTGNDYVSVPKITPPNMNGGEFAITNTNNETYGQPEVLQSVVSRLNNVIAQQIQTILSKQLNQAEIEEQFLKIVDEVILFFSDKLVYYSNSTPSNIVRIDIQNYYDSFQRLIKHSLVYSLFYNLGEYKNFKIDCFALYKSKKQIINQHTATIWSDMPDVLEKTLQQTGIDCFKVSKEIFLFDGNRDTNLIFVSAPDIKIKLQTDFGRLCRLLERSGLLD